jgi:hypothetical protein
MRPDLRDGFGPGGPGGGDLAGSDPAREEIARSLRELPTEVPPPFGWEELRHRATRGRRASTAGHRGGRAERSGRSYVPAAAAAACVAVLLVAAVMLGRSHVSPEHADVLAASAAAIGPAQRPADTSTGATTRVADISDPAQVLEQAQAAERWLATKPQGPAIVRVSAHLAVADLENRIASMDDELDAARVMNERGTRWRTLELDRAQLVDSLAQVRYAEMLASAAP